MILACPLGVWFCGEVDEGRWWRAWSQRWICLDCGKVGMGALAVDLSTPGTLRHLERMHCCTPDARATAVAITAPARPELGEQLTLTGVR